jgi:hypothetical protein
MTIDIRIKPTTRRPPIRLLVEEIADPTRYRLPYDTGKVRGKPGRKPLPYEQLSEHGKKKRERKLRLQAESAARWGKDTSSHSP